MRTVTLVQPVRYAADRIDPSVHFTDKVPVILDNVPHVFLPAVLKGCIKCAKENNVTAIS